MSSTNLTRGLFTLGFIGLLLLGLSPSLSHADTISNLTILCEAAATCTGLSGTVQVTATGAQQLTFVVTNTSTNTLAGSGTLLTGFSGNFSGYTITNGTASLNGSTGLNGATAGDLAGEWGFKNSASGPFASLVSGTTASVATLQAAVVGGSTFGGTTIGGPGGANVNGPGFGILATGGNPGGLAAYQNSLTFVLNFGSNVSGLITQLQNGTFALAFASPTAVPIPATSGLFGIGLVGFVAWRWREEQLHKHPLMV